MIHMAALSVPPNSEKKFSRNSIHRKLNRDFQPKGEITIKNHQEFGENLGFEK